MPAPTQEKYEVFTNTIDNKNDVSKIQNIFSSPSKKIKTPDTQTNPTKTVKLNNDNGLQTRTTEHQLPTAVLQKRVQCLNEALVFVSSLVLADSFVLRNPPLSQAPKRQSI
jgi:hypothetical protein